jgi:hypothetical protein
MTRDCGKLFVSFDRKESAAFWISASPKAFWALSIAFISSECCRASAQLSPECVVPTRICPHPSNAFPAPQEMIDRMRAAGFAEATWTPYTFGIAGLYRGKKSK